MAASPSSARPPPSPTRWRNGSSSEASDGFNVMFPYLPEGLDDFVDRVVPELQRRGIFRTRVRRQDAAREPRPAAAGEPVLLARRSRRSCRMKFGWLTLAHSPSPSTTRARIFEQLEQATLAEEIGLRRGLAHRAQLHGRERLRGPDSVRRRARHAHGAHPHRLRRHPDGAAASGAARNPAVPARQSHARAPRHRRRPRLDLQRVRVHRLRPPQRRRARAHGRGARRDDAGLDGDAARPQGQILHGAPARAAPRARAAAAPADLAQRGVGRLVPHLRREGRADPDRAPAAWRRSACALASTPRASAPADSTTRRRSACCRRPRSGAGSTWARAAPPPRTSSSPPWCRRAAT